MTKCFTFYITLFLYSVGSLNHLNCSFIHLLTCLFPTFLRVDFFVFFAQICILTESTFQKIFLPEITVLLLFQIVIFLFKNQFLRTKKHQRQQQPRLSMVQFSNELIIVAGTSYITGTADYSRKRFFGFHELYLKFSTLMRNNNLPKA